MFSPVRLPSGRRLRNRFVKVAMYEHLANLFGGVPNARHLHLYSSWSEGGWGMIMTGNVQVCDDHLSLGRDIVIPHTIGPAEVDAFRRLADAIHGSGPETPLAIMQLSHTGRQSANILGGRAPFVPPHAPSPVPLQFTPLSGYSLVGSAVHHLMFQKPIAMTVEEINEVISRFVAGAKLAASTGFDGIELHASHGYLIAEFMSPKTNHRQDEYGLDKDELSFLRQIVTAIRKSDGIPDNFVVGIKLNAADYTERSKTHGTHANHDDTAHHSSTDRAMNHLRRIAQWGLVDFMEISGGDYENPDFMKNIGSSPRQALFADFSSNALKLLKEDFSEPAVANTRPLILLTGGLRTPQLLTSALANGHADLLGIGRLSVLYPELPKRLAATYKENSDIPTLSFGPPKTDYRTSTIIRGWLERLVASILFTLWTSLPSFLKPELPVLIGAGMDMARYIVAMRAISYGTPDGHLSEGLFAVIWMWLYVAPGPWTTTSRGRLLLTGLPAVVLVAVTGSSSLRASTSAIPN
ncbi:FMN-linked oxidoreductase [Panus rudis PR-1116 ss-1]|nr:FMN-linked oxidoreductase [Panus rudis PR-1116 ss-1]